MLLPAIADFPKARIGLGYILSAKSRETSNQLFMLWSAEMIKALIKVNWRDRGEHFSIHVVLSMFCRLIFGSHGLRSAIARPIFMFLFGKRHFAVERIYRAQAICGIFV